MDETVRQVVRDRASDRCEYCRLPQAAEIQQALPDCIIFHESLE
jgi:hypothetical protein